MKKGRVYLVGIIVLIGVLGTMFNFSQGLKRTFESEVKADIARYKVENPEPVLESDIGKLPDLVKKYLDYVGVMGKSKIWNVRIDCDGRLKQDENKDWIPTSSLQYNFFERPIRMFYMDAKMLGMPVYGIHSYKEEKGTMLVKALGLIPVVDAKGPEMNASDTVTLFNDMCLFAPAALIDSRISWEEVNASTVKATLLNGGNKVSAELCFNEKGELVNFISKDRYMTVPGGYKKYEWSTPITGYKKIGDHLLPSNASAIWQLEGREFKYAEFNVKEVRYNCIEFN